MLLNASSSCPAKFVEGLLAELEKSKKVIESLWELIRKQFGLIQLMDDVVLELSRSQESNS
jgi:hypothetical protein